MGAMTTPQSGRNVAEVFDRTTYRPRLFDCTQAADRASVDDLVASGHAIFVHDTIDDQLLELVASREPTEETSTAELRERVQRRLGSTPTGEFGTWVFYPWSRRLVHVLPEPDYRFLRHDRNRDKITPEQQHRLAGCCIAVAGLSVGMASVVTLALEGVGGSFRLADFDSLGLSNLNRLKSGVHNLGINKAVLAARELYEIDPYLEVEIFDDGVTDANLDAFLAPNGASGASARKPDLLVEECDDLYTKVRLRERARELGIPVIMETSDRGLLDVERFDRDPLRLPLHGVLAATSAADLRGLSTKDKVPYILGIIDSNQMSTPLLASLIEVKRAIYTWPQLASAVALGGAIITDTARRILLGELHDSGRFYVDLQTLVRDGASAPLPPPVAMTLPTTAEALRSRGPVPLPVVKGTKTPSNDEMTYIVAHAVLAPSGGNVQPWKFRAVDGTLECRVDDVRASAFLDFEGTASTVALGAAVENAVLAAAAAGFSAQVEPLAVESASYGRRIRFERTAVSQPALFEHVCRRATNRRKGDSRVLSIVDASALNASLEPTQCRLQILTDAKDRAAMGELLGRADRLLYLSKKMHDDLIHELRWTPEEVAEKRDGIDLATLDLSPSDVAVMRTLRSWAALERVKIRGGGRALTENAQKRVGASSGVCLLTITGKGRDAYFEGGRALERLWLTSTARGLAVHPWGLPYLFVRLERGDGIGFDEDEKRELASIRRAFHELWEVRADETEILLFCVSYMESSEIRSLRRPLSEVLTLESPSA
jgi:tRNA A37 threonylcarbamoyladenosine dehydratase